MEKALTNRVKLEKFEIYNMGENQTRIEIALSLNNRTEVIEKVIPSDDEIILMEIGLTTLEVIKLLISRPLDCQINYIKEVGSKIGTTSSLQCLLRFRESGKETLLNGTVAISTSIHEAVINSILMALSSTLERLMDLQQNREKLGRSGSFSPSDPLLIEAAMNYRLEASKEISNVTNTNPVATESIALNRETESVDINKQLDKEAVTSTKDNSIEEKINISKVKELFEQGKTLVNKGSYQQAVNFLKEVIRLDDKKPDYHCQLGLALAYIAAHDEAETALLKAVELDPNTAFYKTELGLFYKDCGRIEKAQKFLEEAVGLDSADARAKRALLSIRELNLTFNPPEEKVSRYKTGHFNRPPNLVLNDEEKPTRFQKLLSTPVDSKLVGTIIGGFLVITIAIVFGVYFYNYSVIYFRRIPEEPLNPRSVAIKIVKDFPSKQGKSIEDRINKYLKDQNIQNYSWVSSQENKTKNFIVILIFSKDGKNQKGIWTVDLDKKICNPENELAKELSSN